MARLRNVLSATTTRLAAAGVPSAHHDAEALAAHVLGVSRGSLAAEQEIDEAALEPLVARRASREPLQHILGRTAFRHIDVAVGPGVFVPRPETELLAGFAIDRAREVVGRRPVVVDLCTGSGVIALSVADEVPDAEVHAVELSDQALAWAGRNLAGSGVHLHAGNAAFALPAYDRLVDVVVANPPYIPPDGQIRDPEVLAHDPPLALWGSGPDGLDTVRAVALSAARLLRPGGWFAVEHADVQGPAVVALLQAQQVWVEVADHRDLAGRDRYTVSRRT